MHRNSRPGSLDVSIATLVTRAVTDASFRTTLISDAAAAAAECGVRVPDGYTLRFIERPHDVDRLVILPDPLAEAELDEESLDAVAGGTAEAAATDCGTITNNCRGTGGVQC